MGEFSLGGGGGRAALGGQLAPIVVPVVIDEVAFQAGLKRLDKGMTAFTKRVGVMANKIGNYGLMASGALAAMGFSLLKSARDAESASLKFRAVFREAADETMKFARELGDTFHMTTSEVQGFLGQIQDLFVPMGMSRKEAAKLSESVVDLSTRLAIFNGQPTAFTLQNISSGLIGITRSVRQYGILIDEARVKQEIMNQGWAKSASEITQQQKVLARLNIMLADSADAMAKAPELVATTIKGQMDRVARAFQDLREELGAALAPVLEDLVADIQPMLEGWVEWVKANRELIVQMAGLVPTLLKVSLALKGIGLAMKGVAAAQVALAAGAGGIAAGGLFAGTAVAAGLIGKARIEARGRHLAAVYEQIEEDTDTLLTAVMKKAHTRRVKMFDEMAEDGMEAAVAALARRVVEGEAALTEVLRDAISSATTVDALNTLEDTIFDAIAGATEAGAREAAWALEELLDVIRARRQKMRTDELTAEEEQAQKITGLRVKRFEAAMKQMHSSVVRNLNAELDSLKSALAEQERIRETSLQRVMELRAGILEREIDHEQFLWEAALQDPAVATEARYFETEKRIEDLIDSAGRAADEGNAEVSQQMLTMAEQLSKSLISIDEHTYETRLADARDYLERIAALRDEAAEAEIAASQEAASESARNIEGLKIVMESYILDVEDQLSALAASASDIPLTMDVAAALASIAEVRAAMEGLRGDAGVGQRPGAAAGVGTVIEQAINIFTQPFAETGEFLGDLATKLKSATEAGLGG